MVCGASASALSSADLLLSYHLQGPHVFNKCHNNLFATILTTGLIFQCSITSNLKILTKFKTLSFPSSGLSRLLKLPWVRRYSCLLSSEWPLLTSRSQDQAARSRGGGGHSRGKKREGRTKSHLSSCVAGPECGPLLALKGLGHRSGPQL